MKKIFIINGSGSVGKDTFIGMCEKYIGVRNRSTVDRVKEAGRYLGWEGGKSEEDREFLSDLKLLADKYYNHSTNYILDEYEWFRDSEYEMAMFIHCREPQNIETLKNKLNCETILIRNENVEKIESNMADANVHNYNYDYYIHNNGTLDDLEKMAKSFLEEHGLI